MVEREWRVWIIRRVLTHLVAVVIAYTEGRSSLSNIELFNVSSTGVAQGEGKNFIKGFERHVETELEREFAIKAKHVIAREYVQDTR